MVDTSCAGSHCIPQRVEGGEGYFQKHNDNSGTQRSKQIKLRNSLETKLLVKQKLEISFCPLRPLQLDGSLFEVPVTT